ncbi:MAG: hypothetical protein K8U57_16430 [Planctomycetes bacterium]|nr:hypothetical protein [Planctomycetota bacterium]
MKRLSRLVICVLLIGQASCSREPKPTDAALPNRIAGKWKHTRQNGEPVTIKPGATGLLEFRADGTLAYEEVTEIRVDGKVDSLNVKPSQGKYRFLDGENIEIEGEDRGQIKTWSVKAALKDNFLTLHKPYGQVDEFERVP